MTHTFLKLALALCILSNTVSASFSFDALENEMSDYDKKHSGIEKLSHSEREFIENWLQNREELYHFTAPTVSDVANIKWMYESMRVLPPAALENYDESKLIYKTAICGILDDDVSTLKKWLDHHLKLGCEHFYLYNCLSSDNYMKALSPYIQKGQVELIQWPKVDAESEIFRHAIAYSQKRAKWLIGPITTKDYISNLTYESNEIITESGAKLAMVKPHQVR